MTVEKPLDEKLKDFEERMKKRREEEEARRGRGAEKDKANEKNKVNRFQAYAR